MRRFLQNAKRRWPHLKIKKAAGRRLFLRCEGCRKWRWAGSSRLYAQPRGFCLHCALCISSAAKRSACDRKIDTLVERLIANRRVRRMKTTRKGYVHIQYNGKLQMLHRVIMARFLGRALTTKETIHHKNGRRWDNRLKNLIVIESTLRV
jgi:hypothetical protein